jgi:hypothetical protein
VIDITLSSTDLKREIFYWRVTTKVSLSDHRISRFKIISDPRKLYLYRNPRSTNCELFLKELACLMRGWDKDIVNTCTIDESAAKIQSYDNQGICEIMPPQNHFRGAKYSLLGL